MNSNLLIAVCLTLMLLFMLARRGMYHVSWIKIVPLAVCAAGMGLLGTYIMYFFENGIWYGKSFFGAVLFLPVLLLPLAWLFRVPLTDLLSYTTVPGVSLLAVYKWNCYLEGCCGGKTLWFSADGIPTHFPSQIAEMAAAVVITVLLLFLERKDRLRKKIYPICLLTYGTVRCVLNQFRWEQAPFVFGLTAGTFWSLAAILIGGIWIVIAAAWERKIQHQ